MVGAWSSPLVSPSPTTPVSVLLSDESMPSTTRGCCAIRAPQLHALSPVVRAIRTRGLLARSWSSRSVSWARGDGAALKLAACARCSALVEVLDRPYGRPLHRRGACLLRRVRHASCRLQRQAGCRVSCKRTRASASCLLGIRGAVLEHPARTRLVVLVAVGLYTMKQRCTGGMLLSFGARPWCDVSATTSNAKPSAVCEGSALAPSLAVSWKEPQYSSLLRTRRAPRWVWSA